MALRAWTLPHLTNSPKKNPLDDELLDRLRLRPDARLRLKLVRSLIHSGDAISRLIAGQPFFGLREAEALRSALGDLTDAPFVRAVLDLNGGTRITAHGIENIPETGPVLIASNHPTGPLDFFAHAGPLLERRPDFKVVANADMARFLGPEIIVPVRIDKRTHLDARNPTSSGMHDHLNAGGALLIFGSGRVPVMQDGKLVERSWRPGATRVSRDCGLPIVPAGIDAQNSRYYYGLRNLVRRLSKNEDLALNIASLRFFAELDAQFGGHYQVHYGAPMPSGTEPEELKAAAEALVPHLYADV